MPESDATSPEDAHQPEEGEAGPRRTAAQVVRDIALFFAAPFLTMGSLALFPFYAVRELRQALRDRKQAH